MTDISFRYLKVGEAFRYQISSLQLLRNLRLLYLRGGHKLTEIGYRSLFDDSGPSKLQYFSISLSSSFNDNCIDSLTNW